MVRGRGDGKAEVVAEVLDGMRGGEGSGERKEKEGSS